MLYDLSALSSILATTSWPIANLIASCVNAYASLSSVLVASNDNLLLTINLKPKKESTWPCARALTVLKSLDVTGSVSLTNGAFYQDGVNLVDISLAYAIALG